MTLCKMLSTADLWSWAFSSLGGLDRDLDRMFPAPPLPEEKKTSPESGSETRM
jgi:hypothetical protein